MWVNFWFHILGMRFSTSRSETIELCLKTVDCTHWVVSDFCSKWGQGSQGLVDNWERDWDWVPQADLCLGVSVIDLVLDSYSKEKARYEVKVHLSPIITSIVGTEKVGSRVQSTNINFFLTFSWRMLRPSLRSVVIYGEHLVTTSYSCKELVKFVWASLEASMRRSTMSETLD